MKHSGSPDLSASEALSTDSDVLSPEVEVAIQTDLAPSMAVAMLAKTDHPEDTISPAMHRIAAGASESTEPGLVRIQFIFENGTVLPVDMPRAAGEALATGLARELGTGPA
jgi:hypothetical protein